MKYNPKKCPVNGCGKRTVSKGKKNGFARFCQFHFRKNGVPERKIWQEQNPLQE